MIQSMTGYGKATAELPDKKINVEIKSLNSKAMDLSARIAPAYREKEMEIRNEIDFALDVAENLDCYDFDPKMYSPAAYMFATELVREAEVSGQVGTETNRRAEILQEKTGLAPDISWSESGEIQLNEEVTVTLTLDTEIGLFGEFGSFPITLRSQASGKSEVYWK